VKVNLVAFGIAKDILAERTQIFEFEGVTIADLKAQLIYQYPEFLKLKNISFAVKESYQEDQFELTEAVEVVIIPPVSGG